MAALVAGIHVAQARRLSRAQEESREPEGPRARNEESRGPEGPRGSTGAAEHPTSHPHVFLPNLPRYSETRRDKPRQGETNRDKVRQGETEKSPEWRGRCPHQPARSWRRRRGRRSTNAQIHAPAPAALRANRAPRAFPLHAPTLARPRLPVHRTMVRGRAHLSRPRLSRSRLKGRERVKQGRGCATTGSCARQTGATLRHLP